MIILTDSPTWQTPSSWCLEALCADVTPVGPTQRILLQTSSGDWPDSVHRTVVICTKEVGNLKATFLKTVPMTRWPKISHKLFRFWMFALQNYINSEQTNNVFIPCPIMCLSVDTTI